MRISKQNCSLGADQPSSSEPAKGLREGGSARLVWGRETGKFCSGERMGGLWEECIE